MIQPVQPYIYNNVNNPYAQNYGILNPNPIPQTQTIQMPIGNRNHILVDPIKVDTFVKQKENALPYI